MRYFFLLIICSVFISCKSPVDKIAEIENKLIGYQVDKITFDSVSVDKKNSLFIYNYSVKDHKTLDPKKIDINDKIFEKNIQENLKNTVKITNDKFNVLYDQKFDLVFKYYSVDDKENIANVYFYRGPKDYLFKREPSEWNEIVDLFYETLKSK